MKSLDWTKINNGKDFQRLVNDLFALEINSPGFLSSNPEIGADGGWDGRYDGEFMKLDGLWSFQAKWTKHNLEDAYKQLQKEVKSELKKANENGVKYLLLATNADLRVGTDDHVGKLEKLNKDKKFVEKLFIWPRANLETRIIPRLQLRHDYFGYPQEPMFVPPHVFAESESLLSETFVGREESLNEFRDFLTSDDNLLIIHAGGGYGKTHFVVSASRKYGDKDSGTQIWFCRPGIRNVNEAINELDHQKNTVVILDDAERYLEDARKLLSHTKTFSPGKLKIVLSCRSSGEEIIKNLASSHRVENYKILDLPQLPESDLVDILTQVAQPKNAQHPERIVKELNGNLFLIVTTGKLIRGGEVNPTHIKKQIRDDIDHEAVNALSGLLEEREAKRLLRELSIVVPFSKGSHSGVLNKLSEILEIKIDVLNESVDRLIDSRILRTVGASIRFNPDMKGDIYLSVELDRNNGKELINQIFENWLSISPQQLTANLAAASRHRETRSANEAVKELVEKWISEAKGSSDSVKTKRLELINPIAYLAPDAVIDLLHVYLDAQEIKTEKKFRRPNRDNYGPVIYHLLHIPDFEDKVLNLILAVIQKELDGTYENYTPNRLIKQATSPIEVNVVSATRYLSILNDWLQKSDCTEAEGKLASDGALESLSGSHEYRESYGNQITFGKRTLRYESYFKKPVDEFRNEGMKLLKTLLFHPNDKIKKHGVEVVRDIGQDAISTSDDFWNRILSDKRQAIEWLADLMKNTASYEVLSAIEDTLIRYWANNQIYKELSKESAHILREFPRTIEYIVFRYFVARDIIIVDFAKLESEAPEDERWSWLVHKHFRLRDFDQGKLDKVVKQLSEKYRTKTEVVEFLNKTDEQVSGISQWQYIPLIETWSRFNSGVFLELADNKKDLDKIPERFVLGIYRIASDNEEKYVAKYAQEILDDINNLQRSSVENLLDLISRHKLATKEFLPWLSPIIEKSDGYLKHLILHRSYFIFKDREQDERSKVLDVLNLSLNGVVDSHVLDMVGFLIHHIVHWDLPEDGLNNIRSKLLEIIKDTPSIDYHIDELIKFVVGENIDDFLNLIDYRLQKHKEGFGKDLDGRFDPIPFDGFRSMEGLINSYKDFSKLLDKVHYWKSEELLFSFDIEHLLKNVKKGDEECGDYLTCYVEEKIRHEKEGGVKTAIDALYGIPFGNSTVDLFLNLLTKAKDVDLLEEAQEVLTHQVLSGSYSSTVGEAPPALVNKKEALKKMLEKSSPGEIKNYVGSLLKSIEANIKRHLDEDEEITSPKT